jgi:hypothetical protein
MPLSFPMIAADSHRRGCGCRDCRPSLTIRLPVCRCGQPALGDHLDEFGFRVRTSESLTCACAMVVSDVEH